MQNPIKICDDTVQKCVEVTWNHRQTEKLTSEVSHFFYFRRVKEYSLKPIATSVMTETIAPVTVPRPRPQLRGPGRPLRAWAFTEDAVGVEHSAENKGAGRQWSNAATSFIFTFMYTFKFHSIMGIFSLLNTEKAYK